MKITLRRLTVEERFYPRLEQRPNGCLEWSGARIRGTYGIVTVGPDFSPPKMQWLAHRLSWTLANGPIPEGLHVLHRCDNPPCCNVEHLFLGTHAENMADMRSKGRGSHGQGAAQRAQTHCYVGHPLDSTNTYVDAHGWRSCRTCRREAHHRWLARNKS